MRFSGATLSCSIGESVEKVDLKRNLKQFYSPPSKEVVIVNVPTFNFIMIDGQGNPNSSQEYKDALAALYAMSYALKFMLKKAGTMDYTVMPLEGLWWTDAGADGFELFNLDTAYWTSMIMQPEAVTKQSYDDALRDVMRKKELPSIGKMRLQRFEEGLSVQIMHIGPWSAETPTIERLHRFAEEQGYRLRGKHHEIYLGDPRRTAPEKLKTVIRQPVERVTG